MTRLLRWTGGFAALLLTLSLVRRTAAPVRFVASTPSRYGEAEPITEVATTFLHTALATPRDVDWSAWATPRLEAELVAPPAPRRPITPPSALSVVLLGVDGGSARVAGEARFVRSGRMTAVAFVLELIATPQGWRVDRVLS